MNSVQLVGRLTRNPVVKFEGEGTQVCTFTLDVPEVGREGKTFHLYAPCVAYGRSAEAASLLSAEDMVSVLGKLGWQKRPAKCGEEHSTMVVSVRDVAVLVPAAAAVSDN